VKLALLTTVHGVPEALAAFLRFHRAAGVDVVVVGGPVDAEAASVLERHARDGLVHRLDSSSHTEHARVATDELGADWVIPATTDELWWPRGESLKDVLAVIPPRYGVVQALVRTYLVGDRAVRTSLLGPDGSGGAAPERLLRPVYRTGPDMTLDAEDWTLGGRRVPLRAWYPIEVLTVTADAPQLGPAEVDAGLANGSLARDPRLDSALSDPGAVDFVVPSIVDDASYAVECAAVGEVDLVKLDRQIRDLELRIAELEARFWPRVRHTLRRLARRPS
jgi:hypothetical protein